MVFPFKQNNTTKLFLLLFYLLFGTDITTEDVAELLLADVLLVQL